MGTGNAWERHYASAKSILVYPDESLVRMLKPFVEAANARELSALDCGCGTGRHLRLLRELGVGLVTGLDSSLNALEICRGLYGIGVVQGSALEIPARGGSFDIVVAWGSLHYAEKDRLPAMLGEIRRVMKSRGRLFGTLRTDRDTHMRKGTHLGNNVWITDLGDIRSSVAAFYGEEELRSAMAVFNDVHYGIMERSPLDDRGSILSHWYFWAEK